MTNRSKGILSIVASAFGFALMAMFIRLCDDYGGAVSSFEKSLFRNVVAFAIAATVFCREHRDTEPWVPRLPARSWVLLTLRAVFGTVGIFANFYALSHIPIAEGMTLNKTAPFFTVFFAWLILREKASARQWLILLIAFAGVLLIAKPGFAGDAAFPLAMALLGGAGAGSAYVCVRAMRTHHVPSTLIILFFSAFSTLASIPFLFSRCDPLTIPQVLIMIGAGIGAAIGQFGVTAAYGYAAPREIAAFDYTNVLFTALFGLVFFAQIPDLLSILGMLTIFIASFLNARHKS